MVKELRGIFRLSEKELRKVNKDKFSIRGVLSPEQLAYLKAFQGETLHVQFELQPDGTYKMVYPLVHSKP